MNRVLDIRVVLLLVAGLAQTSLSAAQSPLEKLEGGIRSSGGQTVVPIAVTPQRVYLGAVADNELGRGVRILSIRSGGPAETAGLQTQDLIVGAAGRKVRTLADLTAMLGGLKPGDRLTVEFMRGTRPLRTEIVLAAPPGAISPALPGTPPTTGLGAGRTESIPPPPGEVAPPLTPGPIPPLEGPAFSPNNPQPLLPNSPQAQIEELRRRVDQLERRVQELERALAEARKK